jgi:hypothetical protein
MTCGRCGKDFDEAEARCPHCGEAQAGAKGLFQTSTVLISSGGADMVYRTVEEIPRGLRTRLLKSTSGGNSGIILIADRRGRKEIARVVGKLSGVGNGSNRAEWLTRGQKRGIAAVVMLLALALVAWVLAHHWQ